MEPWSDKFQSLRKNVNQYKRERAHRRQVANNAFDVGSGNSNTTIAFLQTIAMQNLQLQQAMLTQAMMGSQINQSGGGGLFLQPAGTAAGGRVRQERYQVNRGKALLETGPRNREFVADRSKLMPSRKNKASKIRARWRVYIYTVLFALYISKKYRLLKLTRKPKSFIEISIDELYEKLLPFAQSLKDQIKELSVEGADFLLKEGILLFSRRPSKTQTQKFASIINGFIDLSCKVTFHGSQKSKDLIRRLFTAEGIPRSFFWDNEQNPPQNDSAKEILLIYFVFVKCIIVKIILRQDPEMSELEEHNLRALGLTLFRIARQVGSDSTVALEVDSQFKRVIQSFSRGSADENGSFNKSLFKAFANEIKANAAKLVSWAASEVYYDQESSSATVAQPSSPTTNPEEHVSTQALDPANPIPTTATDTSKELAGEESANVLPSLPPKSGGGDADTTPALGLVQKTDQSSVTDIAPTSNDTADPSDKSKTVDPQISEL